LDVEMHDSDGIHGVDGMYDDGGMLGGETLESLKAIAVRQAEEIKRLTQESAAYKKGVEDQMSINEGLRFSRERLIDCEKLAALGRFTADVAHEIRNPLTAVGGFARRLMKMLGVGSREKYYADIIVAEVSRLEKILRDVLTYSRDTRLKFEDIKISEIIQESIAGFEDIIADHKITVVRALDDTPPVSIDHAHIRQVVDNLISNAVDSMPDGGTLTVSTANEKMHETNYAALRIKDTGMGIPKGKLDKIFEPFFTTKEIGVGTGLGLSISRKIMDEHSGIIRCSSVEGAGTVFSLFFVYQAPEDRLLQQCWQHMNCGRDCDSSSEKCPAYPNFGRVCWAVAGTYCEGRMQATYAQKIENCKRCKFYQTVNEKDEAK